VADPHCAGDGSSIERPSCAHLTVQRRLTLNGPARTLLGPGEEHATGAS
jgi:hypothetical protein